MKKFQLLFVLLTSLATSSAFANGFLWHLNAGYAFPSFTKHADSVWLNQFMQNNYTINLTNAGLFGAGIAYNWNFNAYAVDLGASAYYMHSKVSGVNSPFVNWSPNVATLNYHASGDSYVLLLEPKLIMTTYSLQPYLIAGVGIAINKFSNYSESPSVAGSGAAPTGHPFTSQSNTNFAFEAGVGVQYPLNKIIYHPSLALDYRYMNFGSANMGSAGSTSSGKLDFGLLYASVISASLNWQLT